MIFRWPVPLIAFIILLIAWVVLLVKYLDHPKLIVAYGEEHGIVCVGNVCKWRSIDLKYQSLVKLADGRTVAYTGAMEIPAQQQANVDLGERPKPSAKTKK